MGRHAHVGQRLFAAETTLNKVPHWVIFDFFLGDHAFPKQKLDVTMVPTALVDFPLSKQIDSAVSDMRPEGAVVLDQAQRAGGSWACVQRLIFTQGDDGFMGTSDGGDEKTVRVEDRMIAVRKARANRLYGFLRSERAAGVSTHSVNHDQQTGVRTLYDFDAILIVLAMANVAFLSCFLWHLY